MSSMSVVEPRTPKVGKLGKAGYLDPVPVDLGQNYQVNMRTQRTGGPLTLSASMQG
jgi:hypothetical protein